MRTTRTWTISLPPDMSKLAQHLAKQEHRTKSELMREALRHYLAQHSQPLTVGVHQDLARVGELAEFYQKHHATRKPSEAELRRSFRGIRRLHDRLKHLAL